MTNEEIKYVLMLELMSEGDEPNPFGLSKEEQDEIHDRWKEGLPLREMVSCVKDDNKRKKIYELLDALDKNSNPGE